MGDHLVGYRETVYAAPSGTTDVAAWLATGASGVSCDGMQDVDGDTYTGDDGQTYTVDIYGTVFDPGLDNDPGDGVIADDQRL